MECDLGIGSAAARGVLFTIVSTTNGYQNKSVEAEGCWLSVWLLAEAINHDLQKLLNQNDSHLGNEWEIVCSAKAYLSKCGVVGVIAFLKLKGLASSDI
ncbi:unnamed protein product [Prunus armeniaca]